MDVNKKERRRGIRRSGAFVERRKSKDFWARLLIWVNYLAWLILFITLLVFHRAQPEFETLFDRFYQLDLRTRWDMDFVRYLVYVTALGLAASIAGLGLSLFRARRSTDNKVPIIILGGLYILLFVLSWFLL